MDEMMILIAAALAYLPTLVLGLYIFNKGYDRDYFWEQILGVIISIVVAPIVTGIILCLCGAMDNNPTPQAIDVYRGNTTLEITYRDNVPVDSIVVFKKE